MEVHAVGVTRWVEEVSPTLYIEPPRFAPVFRDFYEQQENHMLTQILRARFASTEDMENYFTYQDQEKERRRDHMCAEWTRQNNEFKNTMQDLFRINNI